MSAAATLKQKLLAESLGTALLLATVVGSGIMAERLSGGNVAIALLGNTLPTGAILVVLITMLGPISGAHFNPAVSAIFLLRREISTHVTSLYVVVQIAGAIAGVLLAVMDASIYFGRVGLNNIATPFFIVTGLYFLVRGLRDLQTLNFVLSGFAFTFGLYYYFAGRLSPLILAAIVGYTLLFLPLVRLPGKASELRRKDPGMSRGNAWRGAAMYQLRSAWQYGGKIVILAVAAVAVATG